MNYLIGVDIGTQGTKAALYDEQCTLVSDAFEQSKLIYPEAGAVEQDAQEIFESVLRTISEVVKNSKIPPKDVAAVGMDGQMAGIMGIDKNGIAVTPYDSWLDTRCGKYRGHFLSYGEDTVIALTGAPVTYAHGPKILWWKHERPDIYKNIYRFVQPASYCAMRMCGLAGDDAFIDHTYLHFSGFADTSKKQWSKELLKELNVEPYKMPAIVKPYDIMGKLTDETAKLCGLLPGTPVVAGCGDTAASSLGAGITRDGLLFDVSGSASVLACAINKFSPDIKYKTMMCCPSVIDGLYSSMAYIGGGGMCIKWLRDDILHGAFSYGDLNAMAEKIAPGSGDLLFMPHFSGRVCPNDSLVRGSYVNLSWMHGTAHLYRAILEGIAYEYGIYSDIIKELSPSLVFERAINIGGGSRSGLFRQIKADVLNVPVSTINIADTATLACCIIAGYGIGLYADMAAPIEKAAILCETTEPQHEHTEFYRRRKEIYAELFPSLRGVYSKLQELKQWGAD